MNMFSQRMFITLVTLCMISALDQPKESRYKLKTNHKLRETFNKLLNAVTSVNKERLDALKKFHDLQNYLPKVGRTDDEVVAVIIPDPNIFNSERDKAIYKRGPNIEPGGTPKVVRIFKDTKDNNAEPKGTPKVARIFQDNKDDDESLRSSDEKFLRKWKGCNKSAAKNCKKACNRAFKDVCSDYKCSKSMKRSGRRSCKRDCNSQFGHGDYDY